LIPLPATFVVRWRWPIVLFWVLLTVAVVPAANDVHHRLQVGGQEQHDAESTRAELLIRRQFATPYASFAVVAIRHGDLGVDDPRYRAYLDTVIRALERLPFVLQTLSWRSTGSREFVSDDGRTTFVIAGLRQVRDNDPTSYVPRLREALDEARPLDPGFTTHLTGLPALDFDTRSVTAEDSAKLERAVIPLSLLLLVFAFGTLMAAAMPVVVAFIAIEVTLGLVAMIATLRPMSIFVLNITTMVGLGVGIDYSLLVVTRFREELYLGRDPIKAAIRTIQTASSAVLTSGATVMVGLAALTIVPLAETRSVGIGGLLVVAVAMLLSIFFLPAALAIVGHRVEWPRALSWRLAQFRSTMGWNRYALGISRHPVRALLISGALLAILSAPAGWMRIGLPVAGWFPRQTEASRGADVLREMGQEASIFPIRAVLTLPDTSRVLALERLQGLARLSDAIRADPRVRDVRGVVDLRPGVPLWQYVQLYADTAAARQRLPDLLRAYLSRDGTAAVFDVFLHDSVTLDGSLDAVRGIRSIDPRAFPHLERAEVLVGGFAASSLDLRDELVRRFPVVVALVLGITGLMLGLVFRSVLVPAKAVLMNCFSVAAAFGLTVVVFQWGVGHQLIGLDGPTEAIFILGPVLVFAIVFGLSMDYEVFLLARIKEEFDKSHDNDQATIAGLAATGATITNAALIMILVFGAFAFARVLAVQLVGFGLAVAVLLDATVIRMVMVPALMHLAGRFNWWPGYRRKGGGHYRRGSGDAAPTTAAAARRASGAD
jgi:RND superfamily putative drug exporter